MRPLKSILVVSALLLAIISCKKGDTGPAGPDGTQGAQGPQGPRGAQGPTGVSGNANVILYNYDGPYSLTYGVDLLLTNVSKARMDSSLVLAYYVPASYNTWWMPIPGLGGYGTLVQYQTIYSIYPSGNNHVFALRLFNPAFTTYNGSTVVFNRIKVILAKASSIVQGNRQGSGAQLTPPVDYSDYHAVMKYFGLPE